MMKLVGKLGIAVATLALASSAFAAEYRDGEVIVKYKDNTFRPRMMMNDLYDAAGAIKVRRYHGSMEGFEQIQLQNGVKVQDAIAALMKNNAVEYAQPNYILHALPVYAENEINRKPKPPKSAPPCIIPGVPYPPGCQDPSNPGNPGDPGTPPTDPGNGGSTPPSAGTRPALQPAPAEVNPPVADPELDKLYGLKKIGAQDAWKINKGSKSIIVADIDTGIDYNHEDLAYNVWRNPNPTQNDIVGYDFVHNDGLPYDDNEHGTHTAGTIGAVGGNGKGVSGVSQRVSIMALKFLSGEGSGTTADAIRAIDYAIAHGARIMSNSWGGKGDDNNSALKDAIDRARVKGVLFVAAAGNDGTDNDGSDPSYPASFDNDNMITVAATNEKDAMAFFSNFGSKTTHLAAPGTNIYSTVPGNKYASLSGTSMACPHVAGAAALIWSMHPDWNYQQVKKTLMDSVDPLPTLQGKTVTGGRLNILKALRARR